MGLLRNGTDLDGNGTWDGPRAHVYMRIEDNYDDPANSGTQDRNDEDWRAHPRCKTGIRFLWMAQASSRIRFSRPAA